MVQGYSIHNSR